MNTIAIISTTPTSLLRRALLADVAVTGSAGLLLTVFAAPLGDLLGLPVTLLRTTGIFLLPYTGVVVAIATRTPIPRTGAWAIVALNLLWAAASLALLLTGWVDPSTLGIAFAIAQALAVAAFADVQYLGLRRMDD